jgi:hypothetical protein
VLLIGLSRRAHNVRDMRLLAVAAGWLTILVLVLPIKGF